MKEMFHHADGALWDRVSELDLHVTTTAWEVRVILARKQFQVNIDRNTKEYNFTS